MSGGTLPQPNESTFELPPAGNQLAVCIAAVDIGTQETTFGNKHQFLLRWELVEEQMSDGRPFTMWSDRYTWSMNEDANLRKDLESWRGQPFKESDFGPDGFNVKKLLGVPAMINVVHKDKKNGGGQFSKITAITPPHKSLVQNRPDTENPPVFFWIESPLDLSTFEMFPDWLKDTIKKAPEFARAYDEGLQDGPMVATSPSADVPF